MSAHHGSRILFPGEGDDFSVSVQLAGSAGEVAKGDWEALDAVSHLALQPFEREGSFAASYSTQSERSLMNMCHVSRWAVPAATQSGRRNIIHLHDVRLAAQQCAATFTSLITNAPKVDRRGFLQQFVPTHFRGRPYFRFVDRISCCKVR